MVTVTDYTLVECPPQQTAVVRARVKLAELPSFFARSLPRVLEAIEAQDVTPGGEPFAYYRGVPNGRVEVEAGFPVAGVFTQTSDVWPAQLPGGRVVTGVHVGRYERVGDTYAAMLAWAAARGLRPTGDMWEVYLTDPEREPDPQRWRTGLFLRVE